MRKMSRYFRLAVGSGLTFALWSVATPVHAQSEDALQPPEQFQEVLVDSFAQSDPGAAAIVLREGKVIFRQAVGSADIELGVRLEPEHVFRIASLTKQFTAAAIMLLQERGELSVEDDILRFLPEYPTHGHTIRIKDLMSHTSGIFNYTNAPGFFESTASQETSVEQMIESFKSRPMDFAPETGLNYSNSGYVLLGAIIEQVSGQSYAEFMEENILRPLSLDHTRLGDRSLTKGRVAGYEALPSGDYINARPIDMTQAYAAGALLSTVDDLAKWNAALTNGELISEQSYREMTTPFVLKNGESVPFGYGFRIETLRGKKAIHHSGSINGFSAHMVWLPEEEVYVAVLKNSIGGDPTPMTIAFKLAGLAIGDPFPDFQRSPVGRGTLDRFAGRYCSAPNRQYTLTPDETGGLNLTQGNNELLFEPAGGMRFFRPQSLTYIELKAATSGSADGFELYLNGADQPISTSRC
ncbi:serine hydrolase [Erythrobacter sp. AP23]|uniref:serine hydrolase domain-containing protein n=1 Tax=Erythrobacter sp. AP23 TaxID=499656 RepID=UPI00076BDD62|nr:serine hydrolase domain-containing protein [Erythrobacter sp. AP23]KWV92447.1 hypothetical protein ASS64_14440 [Erythrobacter sp. AP23]